MSKNFRYNQDSINTQSISTHPVLYNHIIFISNKSLSRVIHEKVINFHVNTRSPEIPYEQKSTLTNFSQLLFDARICMLFLFILDLFIFTEIETYHWRELIASASMRNVGFACATRLSPRLPLDIFVPKFKIFRSNFFRV